MVVGIDLLLLILCFSVFLHFSLFFAVYKFMREGVSGGLLTGITVESCGLLAKEDVFSWMKISGGSECTLEDKGSFNRLTEKLSFLRISATHHLKKI